MKAVFHIRDRISFFVLSHLILSCRHNPQPWSIYSFLYLAAGLLQKAAGETVLLQAAHCSDHLNNRPPITSEKTQTMFGGFDTVSNCCHKLSPWGVAGVPCCFEYNVLSNMFSKDLNIHKHHEPQDQIPKRDDPFPLRGQRQNARKDFETSLSSMLTGAWMFVS